MNLDPLQEEYTVLTTEPSPPPLCCEFSMFIYVYVHIYMTVCTEYVCVLMEARRVLGLLELELWVLGTKRRSSGKTASALNCWVISSGAGVNFKDSSLSLCWCVCCTAVGL